MNKAIRVVGSLCVLALVFLLSAPNVRGQEPSAPAPPPPQQRQGMQEGGQRERPLMGTITSVGVDRIEIKRMNGEPLTVLVNNQTRYREDQKDIGLEDLKPGDRVMVRGEAGGQQQFTAAMVRRVTEQDIQRMQGSRAFGEITAIQGNEITLRNPRQGERTVVVNDQTTFTKEGQTISLKDLKVGDRIAAMGHESDGKFVAERIFSGRFMRGRREGRGLPPQP